MTTLPRPRGRGRPLALGAFASTAALLLAACTSSGSTDEGGREAGSPPPAPAWGEWQNTAGTPTFGTATHAVLAETGQGTPSQDGLETIVDSTGTEQWQVPDGTGVVAMDDTAVYTQNRETGAISAHATDTGEELWTYDGLASLHECAPTQGFDIETDPRSPDVLVVAFDDASIDPDEYPSNCFDGMPVVPHLLSLDRVTGEPMYEPVEDSIRLEGITGRFDITGKYYDRLFDLRSTPVLTRTDVHTGETRSVEVELELFENSPTWFSDAGDDAFMIETDSDPEFAVIEEWGQYNAPDYGDVIVRSMPVPDAPPCSMGRLISTTGYTYCHPVEDFFLGTHSQLLGDPSGENLISRDGDDPQPPRWEVTGWEYEHVLNQFETDDTATGWDPVVPESEDGPALVVFPITDNALRAFDLRTGEIAWTSEPDAENPPMGAHHMPGVDEILVGSNGHLRALDARTGEQKWEEPELSGRGFTAHGLALSVYGIDSRDTIRLRLVENAGSS